MRSAASRGGEQVWSCRGPRNAAAAPARRAQLAPDRVRAGLARDLKPSEDCDDARALARRLAQRILVQQTDSSPTPTRPRIWCNCARPKRSACSITISAAFGTSTPTSMRWWPPAGERAGGECEHHVGLSSGASARAQDLRETGNSAPVRRGSPAPSSVAARRPSIVDTPRPGGRAAASRIRRTTLPARIGDKQCLGCRPSGSSSI